MCLYQEIVDFLRFTQKFEKLHFRINVEPTERVKTISRENMQDKLRDWIWNLTNMNRCMESTAFIRGNTEHRAVGREYV